MSTFQQLGVFYQMLVCMLPSTKLLEAITYICYLILNTSVKLKWFQCVH